MTGSEDEARIELYTVPSAEVMIGDITSRSNTAGSGSFHRASRARAARFTRTSLYSQWPPGAARSWIMSRLSSGRAAAKWTSPRMTAAIAATGSPPPT